MERLGIGADVLIGAGLALRKDDGPLRARFWNRLLFPIHDLRGRPVGFGGRVLGDREPKYLNSPDSDIFHKGRLLYHLHVARQAIRKTEHAVLVEGYFDVLRLALAGMDHVVAPLGTGFTADQAQLLKRLAPRVTILFDSDAAGLRATFRTADELLRAGVSVAVATMPEGEDPDTLVQSGGVAAVERVLRDAVDVFERKLQLLERKGWLGTLSGRRQALDRLLPTLRAASDPVTRDLYVARVGEALGVGRESVLREVAERPPRREPEPPRTVATNGATRLASGPEVHLLRAMLRDPAYRARLAEAIADPQALRGAAAEVFRALSVLPADTPAAELLDRLEGEARVLLARLMDEDSAPPDLAAVVAGALGQIESRRLEQQLQDLDRRMPLATPDEQVTMAREKDRLSRKIAELHPARWNVIRKGRGSAR
jgi:DNA primase